MIQYISGCRVIGADLSGRPLVRDCTGRTFRVMPSGKLLSLFGRDRSVRISLAANWINLVGQKEKE